MPEQLIDRLGKSEALPIANSRCHPARANDSNSNLTSGIVTGGSSRVRLKKIVDNSVESVLVCKLQRVYSAELSAVSGLT